MRAAWVAWLSGSLQACTSDLNLLPCWQPVSLLNSGLAGWIHSPVTFSNHTPVRSECDYIHSRACTSCTAHATNSRGFGRRCQCGTPHGCGAPCCRFRLMETERFWEGLRQQVLERAGLPPDSKVCPAVAEAMAAASALQRPRPTAQTPQQTAGIVMGVIMAVLMAGVVMLLHKAWMPGPGSMHSHTQAHHSGSNRCRYKSRVVVRSVITHPRKQKPPKPATTVTSQAAVSVH